jgi:hypothetical protein
MNIVTNGIRSDAWRPFVKQKMKMLKDMGITSKSYIISGYLIRLSTIDGIDEARIIAPPGAVVVDFTGGKYEYRYCDQYGGDFVLTMSRPPSEGNAPTALFSGLGEVMYHGSSDFFASLGVYGTLSGSWYAPRPIIVSDPTDSTGYLNGVFDQSEKSPSTTPFVGYGFTLGGNFYSMSTNTTSSSTDFDQFLVSVVRGGLRITSSLSVKGQFPGFRGKAHYMRPIWGENAAMIYVVHNDGKCSEVLGPTQVLAYVQEVGSDPFSNGVLSFAGQVNSQAIAQAFGLPAPCSGDGSESQLITAMYNLIGVYWPFNWPPYNRGSFSYGLRDVCFWGPVPPDDKIKGVVFSLDGTVNVKDIVLPAYDNTTQLAVISEVSPGYYICEIRDANSNDFFNAVYYGSPFGGWTLFNHPPGVIVRHRTVSASSSETKALALIFADGVTKLYEYDSSAESKWIARGKVADGRISRADVAVFGDHKFAELASKSSPTRALWF